MLPGEHPPPKPAAEVDNFFNGRAPGSRNGRNK